MINFPHSTLGRFRSQFAPQHQIVEAIVSWSRSRSPRRNTTTRTNADLDAHLSSHSAVGKWDFTLQRSRLRQRTEQAEMRRKSNLSPSWRWRWCCCARAERWSSCMITGNDQRPTIDDRVGRAIFETNGNNARNESDLEYSARLVEKRGWFSRRKWLICCGWTLEPSQQRNKYNTQPVSAVQLHQTQLLEVFECG